VVSSRLKPEHVLRRRYLGLHRRDAYQACEKGSEQNIEALSFPQVRHEKRPSSEQKGRIRLCDKRIRPTSDLFCSKSTVIPRKSLRFAFLAENDRTKVKSRSNSVKSQKSLTKKRASHCDIFSQSPPTPTMGVNPLGTESGTLKRGLGRFDPRSVKLLRNSASASTSFSVR